MTQDAEQKCARCNRRAEYQDTVANEQVCSDCAKESALERMLDDREITPLETACAGTPG